MNDFQFFLIKNIFVFNANSLINLYGKLQSTVSDLTIKFYTISIYSWIVSFFEHQKRKIKASEIKGSGTSARGVPAE